ncbi:hypothetical protein [Rhizobium leguminosarum]|uniref:hypothetical protein n=2 Tax=Rhizobium leguminosarum TaxID=384 RepID=UPI003F9D6FCF
MSTETAWLMGLQPHHARHFRGEDDRVFSSPISWVRCASAMGDVVHGRFGAGRNPSRNAHIKRRAAAYGSDERGLSPRGVSAQMIKETADLDVRFYAGFAEDRKIEGGRGHPYGRRPNGGEGGI